MERSPSLEAINSKVSDEIFRHYMDPNVSLPHSQQPATCPYPEQNQCITSLHSTSLHILILFYHRLQWLHNII